MPVQIYRNQNFEKVLHKHLKVCFSTDHVSDNSLLYSQQQKHVRYRNGAKHAHHAFKQTPGRREGKQGGVISWTAKLLTLTVSQGNRNKGKNKQTGPSQTYKHLFAQQRKPKTK